MQIVCFSVCQVLLCDFKSAFHEQHTAARLAASVQFCAHDWPQVCSSVSTIGRKCAVLCPDWPLVCSSVPTIGRKCAVLWRRCRPMIPCVSATQNRS